MNILSALLTYPQTVPPNPPGQQLGGIVKQIGNNGPNFGAIAPLIGIIVSLAGIILALMVLGGFISLGTGGLKWSFTGGNERGAAAARKGLTHGGAVLGVVLLIATIAAFAASVIAAFG